MISGASEEELDVANQIADLLLEIERLNNIIDELEKWINEEIEDYNKALNSKLLSESGKEKYEAEKVCFLDILDKLNELKGDNK